MYITSFAADGFRNLKAVRFEPDSRFNVIIGDNAQGKTNLLDAIWLMTGCRNFHGVKDRHYLGFDAPFFQCDMRFYDGRREQRMTYSVQRGRERNRTITINGVPTAKTGGLFEAFNCVAFSPSDVEIVNGAPEKRRSFMDLCACQLKTSNMDYVGRASQLLMQRNAGIHQVLKGRMRRSDVTMWDAQLAKAGALISCMRAEYIRNIAPVCKELYSTMTGGREALTLRYRSAVYGDEELPERPEIRHIETYENALLQNLDEDLRLGYTQKGMQRDDLILEIGGTPVHLFGSQGQRKSAALVLKLAQAYLYYEKRKCSPVILLDDVMGELDERRQRLICEMASDMQVFLTLCHPSSLKLQNKGMFWKMQEGILTAMDS